MASVALPPPMRRPQRLWATDLATCNDTGSASTSAGSASSSAAACALPAKTLLKKLDPQTGEVVAKIEVGRGAVDIAVDESSGAVWVAGLDLSEDYVEYDPPKYSEDRKLSRVDPATNRVVAEIPIRAGSPDGGAQSVAVGKSEVWAQSVDGRLFKVNPATNEVAAMVSLGEWSSHLAVSGGAVWATVQVPSRSRESYAPAETRLVRVDPSTEHVVASEDIGPVSRGAGLRLVAGGGYVWFACGGGLARV